MSKSARPFSVFEPIVNVVLMTPLEYYGAMVEVLKARRSSEVDVQHLERHAGTSSYNLPKLIRHALHGAVGQSQRLLHLSIALGFAYFAAAMVATTAVVVRYLFWGIKEGWASVIVILLASTGCILLTLGIVGIYIGSIFEQVRGRPLFLIDETTDQEPR
jgi:dolichol-phosphate mannosyltransferase